ncbi:MAG: Ig-like domain-containing protein [Candidatus Dormibacteria bacterium]
MRGWLWCRPDRVALPGLLAILCGSLTSCFSAPPQVVALEPNNGSANVAADAPVRVRFDRAVTVGSLRPRLHVDPVIAGCDLAAAWSSPADARCHIRVLDGGALVELQHRRAPFVADTKYTFRLDGGFVDTAGVSNSLDHRWEITTGAPPRLSAISPADGATGVAADAAVVMTFNNHMRPETVAAAVSLEPPLPGTRVYANSRDHDRFVVVPGRLLSPGRTYTVRVTRGAVEEHGLPLAAPATIRFTAGALSHDGHALVLAGPGTGGPADQVLLTALGPRVPGDPVPAASIYETPRCSDSACGPLGLGERLQGIAEAAISPDGRLLALVLDDRGAPGESRLVVQPTGGGGSLILAGGASHLSWSPDSTRLAYAAGGSVHIVGAGNGADLTLPPGRPLSAPALWEPGGSSLVLPVGTPGDPGTTAGIDLADASLGIRYPLPVLSGILSAPTLSPSGFRLAVRRDGDPLTDGTWTIPLAGGAGAPGAPARVAADLTPVAWAGESTLLALASGTGGPGLVRVNLASGDRTSVPGVATADLGSLVATAGGRQLAYLHLDPGGVRQAFIENADGSNPTPITPFASGDRAAVAVSVSG